MNEMIYFFRTKYSTLHLTLFCFSCTQHILDYFLLLNLFKICLYPHYLIDGAMCMVEQTQQWYSVIVCR